MTSLHRKVRSAFLASYLTGAIVLLVVASAAAQSRCDCSIKLAACEAAISVSEKSFTMTSNTPQCSKLEWVLDKESKTTIVIDGKISEKRLQSKGHPDFWLKRCYVCSDTKFPAGKPAAAAIASTQTGNILGKWCSQEGKASHTISPDGVVTKLDFGRPGRKFDKFSCNPSLSQCVGEINGINNVLRGEGMVNFRYVYSVKAGESVTLVIERLSATDVKILGSTTTHLSRCQ